MICPILRLCLAKLRMASLCNNLGIGQKQFRYCARLSCPNLGQIQIYFNGMQHILSLSWANLGKCFLILCFNFWVIFTASLGFSLSYPHLGCGQHKLEILGQNHNPKFVQGQSRDWTNCKFALNMNTYTGVPMICLISFYSGLGCY